MLQQNHRAHGHLEGNLLVKMLQQSHRAHELLAGNLLVKMLQQNHKLGPKKFVASHLEGEGPGGQYNRLKVQAVMGHDYVTSTGFFHRFKMQAGYRATITLQHRLVGAEPLA